MDGILIVDKPEGITSAGVVRVVKRTLRCKTGHLGTLDPFASGVLPICLDQGTKLAQFLSVADKEYVGSIQLGSATDTGDPTGTVTQSSAVPSDVHDIDLNRIAQTFLGQRLQIPPMYSAIKQAGQPLYKLARAGVTVEREARRVEIKRLTLAWSADDRVDLQVDCSKGTYVRVLAEEIAAALGTVGHLASLRRTRFGHFSIAAAVTIERLEAESANLPILSLRQLLDDLELMHLDASSEQRARHGDPALLATLRRGTGEEAVALIGSGERLAAVITWTEQQRWRYARVFE